MVNGPDDVYVEREGRIERVEDRLFEGEESVLHLIERIVGPLGLRVDQGRGDAHSDTDPDPSDAWLTLRIVAALLLRLEAAMP